MDIIGVLLSIQIVPAILFIMGIALIMWELFMPGFGLPGISGVALLITGVVIQSETWEQSVVWIVLLAVIIAILIVLSIHSASKGWISRSPLILRNATSREEGFSSTEDLERYVGQVGETKTVLRPAGTVDINGVRLDVVSESAFINKGVKVRVQKIEGRRVVVQPLEELENN